MKKSKVNLILKIISAMIVAFITLNLACMFFYNVPVHKKSETYSTDYIWEKNKFYSRGTEGFANGVTDENGFNNLQTFENGQIDAIVMGSSHMEAFNVARDKNAVVLLNDKLKAEGLNLNVYNIGISGHTIERCLNNLENAIDEFKPNKYVIIETQKIVANESNIKKILDGTYPRLDSHDGGIIGTLQRMPYLRLVYSQLKNLQENNLRKENNSNNENTKKVDEKKNDDKKMLNTVINKSSKICEEAGVELIIFYNRALKIDEYGNVLKQKDIDDVNTFRRICEENGVTFVNMYDAFKENYIKNHKMPHGFSNTEIGVGHLNEEGHRVIAEKLFTLIADED